MTDTCTCFNSLCNLITFFVGRQYNIFHREIQLSRNQSSVWIRELKLPRKKCGEKLKINPWV